MADTRILLKKSGIKGKTPAPADAEFGELFLNYHSGDPMLCFKDNAGEIVQIKPTKVIDGGGGEVPPTVDVEVGDTLWDGTHLLVWDGSEWVQIGPQDYWDRTGTTLSPVNAGDSVDIGGQLVVSPSTNNGAYVGQKEAFEAKPTADGKNGTRLFAGSVSVSRSNAGVVWQGRNVADVGAGTNNFTSTIYGDGTAYFGGTIAPGQVGHAPNISLNADGAISTTRSSSTGAGIRVRNTSTGYAGSILNLGIAIPDGSAATAANFIYCTQVGDAVPAKFTVIDDGSTYIGGAVGSSNISLNADGSGVYEGGLETKERLALNARGATDSSFGEILWLRTSSDGGASSRLSINTEATALGTYPRNSTDLNFIQRDVEDSGGANIVTMKLDGQGNLKIGGADIANAPNITLNASGSATFAGKVNSPRFGNTGSSASIAISTSGTFANSIEMYNGSTSTSDGVVFTNNLGGSVAEHARISNDGSASFKGTVEANGGFTENGNPINFSDINAARETFQELQVAVENATDFSSLRAAMLVALEDWSA